MIRLYFSRLHTRGLLKGLITHDSMRFINPESAVNWYKAIERLGNQDKLEYILIDRTFQARRVDNR